MISANATTYAADRVFKLKLMEGKQALGSSTGIVDPTLFKADGNKLHGLMDSETCLWYFKYEKGALPPALRDQTFTSFAKLKQYAEDYFRTRNVEIEEVVNSNDKSNRIVG
jgi:hypothetical protein